MSKIKVLITGATGFIGQHITRYLIQNNYEVFAFIRNPEKKYLLPSEVNFIIGNLQNIESLPPLEVEVVVHCAGLTKGLRCRDYFVVNTQGTFNILKWATNISNIKHFILISSLAATGPTGNRPVSCYGKSKQKAEEYLKNISLPWTIIRPPAVFGPGEKDISLTFKFIEKGIAPIIGSSRKAPFIYVEDLVKFIGTIFLNPSSFYKIYIPYNYYLSFEELTDNIIKVINPKCKKIFIPDILLKIICYGGSIFNFITKTISPINKDKLKELLHTWILPPEAENIKVIKLTPLLSLQEALKTCKMDRGKDVDK